MAAKAKQRALTAKGMLSHGQKISRGLLSGSEPNAQITPVHECSV